MAKAKAKADPRREAAMAAKNPAEFARALELDPKRVRARLRSRLNVRVSDDPTAFNADVKGKLYDLLTATADTDTASE